jgi:ribosomal protein L29
MSNMKEIQKKDDKNLVAYVQEKREEVRAFRFKTSGAATRNVRAIALAKKEIARSLFELSRRARTNSQVK